MLPRTSKPNRNRTSRKPNPPATSSASTLVFNVMDLVTPPEAAPMASYVDRASADGRSIVRETVRVAPPSPLKRARLGEPTMTAAVATPAADSPRRKIATLWPRTTLTTLTTHLSHRCPAAQDPQPKTPRAFKCCLDKHVEHPLHVISEWNGIFFAKTLLRDLGLRIQFGHAPREACGNPQPGYSEFVVLHDNGIHSVHVDFCGCDSRRRTEPYIQLLQVGWYPATDERPQTAATFLVLYKFHVNTLQAKMTAYDFYTVLERLTDNAGIKPPNRYQIFLRMARQWRHLLMLKRAGRGHDPSGINLPESWENAPPEDRFLYILFIALDACFRLKRHMISSEIKDPGLGTGWAYVTENPPYRHYLLTVTEQKEMSTCSGLAALDYANTKFSRGYSTTGVGMGVCARHEFVQANGVGDLQKGERFANMDYIFGSILRHKDPRIRKIISYDIVCQWWKYLMEHMQKLPPLVRISMIMSLFRFVIPKMHIHAHTLDCQVKFSLNLVPGSGQTDGEGIERPWASIGAITSSTRLLFYGDRLDNARKEAASQRAAFEAFSLEQIERVPVWKKMIDDFEKDPTKRNPYELKMTGLTEMEVRLQFAKEEEEDARKGVPALHDVSPSGFVTAGLELEEQQRRVRVQAELKKAGSTTAINVYAGGNTSPRQASRSRRRGTGRERPAHAAVLVDAAEREDGGCARAILEIENSLREAQCRTALPRLRRQLHVKSRLLLYKKHNSRHQGMNTRSRTIVARNESKIRLHSEKFQMAWQARLLIAGGNKDKVGWPQLKKEDIRCMQDAEELSRNVEKRRRAAARREQREDEMRADGLLPLMDEDDDEMVTRGGENVRQVSWIWTMAGTGDRGGARRR
ncbi:hypothetical protein B0H14DRAFT_3531447 [Mycena olivaceomarginata]|nr:hypothetical protein B0H14DRAFT_3531447 [Mycena olivaceomarginata]